MGLPSSLAFSLLLACTCICAANAQPWFCHGYDCPKFKVLRSLGQNTELRELETMTWVNTMVVGKTMWDARAEGYQKLQVYLDKGNVAKEQIERTNPVFTLMYPNDTAPERVDKNFTMEFFIPHKYNHKPPKPKQASIKILTVSSWTVYIHSFSGNATKEEIVTAGYNLLERAKKDFWDIFEDAFGFAQYDNWGQGGERHNEVWVWPRQKLNGTTFT